MWYVVIILSVICAGFFIWISANHKSGKRKLNEKKEKPPFRTKEVLEEYGKPMKDDEQQTVDFDDAD